MFKHWKRWAVLALAISWAVILIVNHQQRARIETLMELVQIQKELNQGLGEVNQVCEVTLMDLSSRLGLDNAWLPLVNTALYRRAAPGYTIEAARKILDPKAPKSKVPSVGIGGGE